LADQFGVTQAGGSSARGLEAGALSPIRSWKHAKWLLEMHNKTEPMFFSFLIALDVDDQRQG
jgi:hypothetical protein